MQRVNMNNPGSKLLRTALASNAVFSFVSGLLMLIAAGYVASLLGKVSPVVIAGIGLGLVVFAGWLFFMARSDSVSVSDVWTVIAGDITWVLASAVLMLVFTEAFTQPGLWLTGGIAVVVLTFADLQFFGLRRTLMTLRNA